MPKILLLGSGFVAGPFVDFMLRRPENEITIACRHKEAAEALSAGRPKTSAIALDVQNAEALKAAVGAHDMVISLIPYTFHPLVIQAAIDTKTNFVSTSYVSAVMAGMDAAAKEAGITVMNEIGVDPGIDHLYAMKIIDEAHAAGSKIKSFLSYCGGLPAPEASNNPLGYKLSWSARGVLLAATNAAKFYRDGKIVEIEAKDLLSKGPEEISIYPAFAFQGYPNRDSTPYKERYGIPEADTILRGTLRYKGNPAFIKCLGDLGYLNDDKQDYLATGAADMTWSALSHQLLGAASASVSDLAAAAKAKLAVSDAKLEKRLIQGLKWIGVFGDEVVAKGSSILDALAANLTVLIPYKEGERDMLMLQHKFEIELADGSHETRTSTMLEFGIPNGATAMSRTVGIPCAIAAQLILDGKITRKGVLAPLTADLYLPIIEALEKEGISCKEEVIDRY